MRIFGYFLLSLLVAAGLSLSAGEMFGDGFGIGYFVAILIALGISIVIGLKLKIVGIDIAAVNSFAGFAFSVPLVRSYTGPLATLLAIIFVAVVCVSSVYLFLRIFEWVGPKRTSK